MQDASTLARNSSRSEFGRRPPVFVRGKTRRRRPRKAHVVGKAVGKARPTRENIKDSAGGWRKLFPPCLLAARGTLDPSPAFWPLRPGDLHPDHRSREGGSQGAGAALSVARPRLDRICDPLVGGASLRQHVPLNRRFPGFCPRGANLAPTNAPTLTPPGVLASSWADRGNSSFGIDNDDSQTADSGRRI